MYRVATSMLLVALSSFGHADAKSDWPLNLGANYYDRLVQYEPIPADCSDDDVSREGEISAKRFGAKVVVDIFMSMNCSAVVSEPTYKAKLGHTLSIKTRYESDEVAVCSCRYGLRFTLHEEFAAKAPANEATYYRPERAKIRKGEPIYFVVDDAVTLKTNAP
jgi:hypothetical protein